jgi:hypothetical protein
VRRALGQLANAVGPSNDLLTLRVQIARWERTYV